MTRVVRAFPVLPGKRDALVRFFSELKARKAELDQFYRSYGVSRESAHLQSTSHGELLIVCTDLATDPSSSAKSYAVETAPFHAWFKASILELSGIDPNWQPFGPESTCISDWRDDE